MVFCRRKNANTQRLAARILSIVLNTTDLIANRDCMNFKNDLGRQQNLSRNGSSVHLMNYVLVAAWTPK